MPDSARKILLLFAHPNQEHSEVNLQLFRAACALPGVTGVDLYAEYPDFVIDIDREQQRLLEHEVIVFQHPLYWYSTPALLKEWQDLVLEHGFAYGSQGKQLHGKLFFCALSAGGPELAYQSEGYNHYPLIELLRPLQAMANLCGMRYLPPFVLFGARTAVEEQRLSQHQQDWLELITALSEARLDIDKAQNGVLLNQDLPSLLREATP